MNQRVNEQIRISPVRLIDQEGTQHGVMPTDEALRMARSAGLDLVEVSPNERPPVCKIMDYGKTKYLRAKKTKQKHHEQRLKEVRLRPKTDPHDKEIKLKQARKFLEHGDKVQFTMRFRGRERFHREIGTEAFDEIAAALQEIGKVDQPPRMMGPRMTMLIVPLKAAHAPATGASKPAKKQRDPSAAHTGNGQGSGIVPPEVAREIAKPDARPNASAPADVETDATAQTT